MLGYVHNTTKQWRVWDPVQRTVTNVADVVFDESNNTAVTHLSKKTVRTLPDYAVEGNDILLQQVEVARDQSAAPDEDSDPMDLIPIETSTTELVHEDTSEPQSWKYNLRGRKVLSALAGQETAVPTSY